LGLEPDEPGSMDLGVQTIQIRQRSPRSYDGLDISVDAPLEAELRVRLTAADATDAPRDFRFKLAELVSGAHPAENDAAGRLDDLGNRLVIARAPGDLVRVDFERSSLVVAPGESFRFTVSPHLLNVEAGAHLRMKLHVVERLTGQESFAREQDVKAADDGTVGPWGPHEFVVPEGDGVYELLVTINRRAIRYAPCGGLDCRRQARRPAARAIRGRRRQRAGDRAGPRRAGGRVRSRQP
jgi:hypothetical protein